MSLWLNGGVAAAYAASVIGVHRWAVHRRRRQAQGYLPLRWLDWDTLLEGTLPPPAGPVGAGPQPPEGGPPPLLLSRPPMPGFERQHGLLCALVAGAELDPASFSEPGFRGGEGSWLQALASLRRSPDALLARLEASPANTVAEAYLRAALGLERLATPLNLELLVFTTKRRASAAIARFGDHPALYFARARASALLGFHAGVIDDLARAVYFSRESPFYLAAVTSIPFVAEVRPALARACRLAQERAASGEGPPR